MPGGIKSNKSLILTLILIFFLGLGVRIGLIIISPGYAPYYGMVTPMGVAARNLVEGRGYVIDSEYVVSITSLIEKEHELIDIQDVPPPHDERFTPYYLLPPGTSAMLAGTYLIFGQYRYIYLRYVQAIIDSFGCLLIFLIGRELFSRKIGLISAFLYAVWLPIAFLSTWPLHDALMPFMTLLSLYFFVKAVRTRAIKFYILSALVIGISCYFQPSTQLLPLFFGLGLFIYSLRKSNFRENILNVAKVTVIMMAVLVLVISPWIARNYYVTGAVFVMRPGTWSGIWEGFGEFGENPVGAQLSDEATHELARKELGYDIEYLSSEYQAFFKTKVLKAITEYPGWYISLIARRVPRTTVYTSELGINCILRDADYQNPTITEITVMAKKGTLWEFVKSHPCATIYRILVYLFGIVPVLLSIFGIWVVRRNWRALALVLTVTVYFAAVHIVFFTASYKSMVPASLGYIIFSAIALDYIYRKIRGAESRTDELATPPN